MHMHGALIVQNLSKIRGGYIHYINLRPYMTCKSLFAPSSIDACIWNRCELQILYRKLSFMSCMWTI